MSGSQYPSQFFSDETAYLLDSSAKTEAKYIALARERAQQLQESEAESKAAAAAIESERRKAESLTESELRDVLQESIDTYDIALNQVGIAEANVKRAALR